MLTGSADAMQATTVSSPTNHPAVPPVDDHGAGERPREVRLSTAPRIDTLRNQLRRARLLLDDAGRVVEALHDLAYDRTTGGERLGVTVSEPEGYSLDSHGDPKARAAYAALGREVDAACAQINGACRHALKMVDRGDQAGENRRAPVSIDVVEHLHALDAQARRGSRGEFDAGRTMVQPLREGTQKSAARRIRSLEAQLQKRDRLEQRRIRTLEAQVKRKDHSITVRDREIAALRDELDRLRAG